MPNFRTLEYVHAWVICTVCNEKTRISIEIEPQRLYICRGCLIDMYAALVG